MVFKLIEPAQIDNVLLAEVEGFRKKMETLTVETALGALKSVNEDAPVDTGRYRASIGLAYRRIPNDEGEPAKRRTKSDPPTGPLPFYAGKQKKRVYRIGQNRDK